MNWTSILCWLLPGAVVLGGLSGVAWTDLNWIRALTLGVGAYLLGGLSIAILYEIGHWLEKLRTEKAGTARFGRVSGAEGRESFGENGIIVGQNKDKILRYNKPGHVLTVSKTRGGKGVSSVIPNLLDYRGSCFCIDIKGENFAITGRHRAGFTKVHAIAPFEDFSSHFNPLDFVRPGLDEIDDASLVAALIVTPSGSDDVFWEREARTLITSLILYVVRHCPRETRHLAEVRRLLTLGPEAFDLLLESMRHSPHAWIKKSADAFMQKAEKERSGVISTAQSHTKVFDSPRLAKITSHSDFQLEDLKRRDLSVYLIIPPHQVAVYRPFLRLMVGLATASMTRNRAGMDNDVLFLLDEFPSLGKMPVHGFAYLAGYGVRLWVFTQSLDQLEAIYGSGVGLITANCAVTQAWALAPTDIKTAEYLSRTLGERTMTQFAQTRSAKTRFSLTGRHYTDSKSERTRRLLTPDEILCLPDKTQLLFATGCRPFLVERVLYYRQRCFKGLFDVWQRSSGNVEARRQMARERIDGETE